MTKAQPTVARLTPARGTAGVDAARELRERARARSGSVDVLAFRIGTEQFGVDLTAVEEAIDLPAVHHVPEMPPSMFGVISVRGSLTPVYSPQTALGLPLASGGIALIFSRARSRFALVIDDVDDVTTVDLAQLRDTAGLDAGTGVLLGVVRRQDALLALVDVDSLLAACQAAPTLEIA
jgi:chemotaxis signal transduction protein